MRRISSFTLAITIGAVSAGCSDSGPSKAPGGEEGPLGGKSDSFFKPSAQGELRFGAENFGAFTDDEHFLSWTFELSDDAEVTLDITSQVSNLDTVMYVYHRDSSDETWGRYKKKNDDFDGSLLSHLDFDGEAGEYRVIVKPFKLAARGQFGLHGACDGSGCPVPDASCELDEPRRLPSMAGFANQSCASELIAVMDSDALSTGKKVINEKDRCSLSRLEALGVEHYIDYWTNEIGFPEIFEPADPDVGMEFAVAHTKLENGTQIVSVDIQADEDNVTFVYDANEKLVFYYHSEQSPFPAFNCAQPGDEVEFFANDFDEFCAGSLLRSLPGGDASRTTLADVKTVAGARGDFDETPGLGRALELFVAQANLADDDEISFELISYEGVEQDGAFELSLGSNGISNSYFIGDDFVIFEDFRTTPTFICESNF